MAEIILRFDWLGALLVMFTIFLVISDRAFSKKVRTQFLMALIASLVLSLLGQHLTFSNMESGGLAEQIVFLAEMLLRPMIVWLMVVVNESTGRRFSLVASILALGNIVCCMLMWRIGSYFIFILYLLLLLAVSILKAKKNQYSDYLFSMILVITMVTTLGAELFYGNHAGTDNALCLLCSVEYFYIVMRTYKKDGLTGLLIRHNLNYEMEDYRGKEYDLVLIDVDNFKLINDKYGHDRGDDALITIVQATERNLPKGCRMYRFGGDEFVIISRKVTPAVLMAALEKTNEDLAAEDLHISFGMVHHNPGEESNISLVEADQSMYANKRQLKSEDIWDDMTGLYNYRGFLDELLSFRMKVERSHHRVCLLGVDVDRLNNINMVYGYTDGNLVISTLARVLKENLRGRDFVGHLGSDEFVVAIDCLDEDDDYITSYISSVYDGMTNAYELANKEYSVKVNVSREVVEPFQGASEEELVNQVIYSKQVEKENRRKNDVLDGQQDYDEEEAAVVAEILDNNLLDYAFQPIVSARDGSIVAYECLMRSTSPTQVSPIAILKYAERSKRLYDVERFTFFNVFSKIASLKDIPDHIQFFVNSMPGHSLTDVDYDLLRSRYPGFLARTVIEMTEQKELSDDALATINRRREADHFETAIDDYGSGVSNTNNLLRYMPKVVKIDRMLITGIDRNPKKQFLVSSIISFAKDNDMLILAEGVETENELKSVIRLGVDLIQGYVAAKPTLEVVNQIPEHIVSLIMDENLRAGTTQRMAFSAGNNSELSVVSLAMEDYTKINVGGEVVTLVGSAEYAADIVVRIKDGITCQLTLRDVSLNSVDDEPCISLGEGTDLTINLEGQNKINGKGIYVPEGSSLTIIGSGNMDISVKGHQCYAIGADTETGFGNIFLHHSGMLTLFVDGEECVGIGGGITGSNSAIMLGGGSVTLNMAAVNAVGIGAYKGNVPIDIQECDIKSNFRVSKGAFLGVWEGEQNVHIQNFTLELAGSGKEVAGIGSIRPTTGHIEIQAGTCEIKMSGQSLYLMGCPGGDVEYEVAHAGVHILGEGDNVLGIGSIDNQAGARIDESSLCVTINASNPKSIGAANRYLHYMSPDSYIHVNGESEDV